MPKELVFSLTKKDFIVETSTSSTKAGGQNRDKNQTSIRITHPASGAVGTCQDTRSQLKNKNIALKRLTETPKFKIWLAKVTSKSKSHFEIEAEVDRELSNPKITKVEYLDED